MELPTAVLLPLWALIMFEVSTADPCGSGLLTTRGECCSVCPPAYGVSVPCGNTNTKCELCKMNVTFSSTSSATERCMPCSRCPAHMEMATPCTPYEDSLCQCIPGYYLKVTAGVRHCLPCRTECGEEEVEVHDCTHVSDRTCVHVNLTRSLTPTGCVPCSLCPEHMEVLKACTCAKDTVCQCASGTYRHVEDGKVQCRPCQVCPRGHGARTPCSRLKDTQCEACTTGFYSEEKSSVSPCLPCRTDCDEGQVVLRECTTSSDMLCMGKLLIPSLTEAEKNGAKRMLDAGSSTSPNSTEFIPQEDHSKNIIPVYCSILGAVVVGLIAYVAFKCWSTCKQKKQLAKARAGELGSSPETEKLHSDSGVFLDTHSLQEPHQVNKAHKTEPKLYSSLPPHKHEEVERLLGDLSHGKDWQRLAILLGFEEESIDAFSRGEHPVHTLLSSWSAKEGATLEVLCAALINMQRPDVVECLNSKVEASSVV